MVAVEDENTRADRGGGGQREPRKAQVRDINLYKEVGPYLSYKDVVEGVGEVDGRSTQAAVGMEAVLIKRGVPIRNLAWYFRLKQISLSGDQGGSAALATRIRAASSRGFLMASPHQSNAPTLLLSPNSLKSTH